MVPRSSAARNPPGAGGKVDVIHAPHDRRGHRRPRAGRRAVRDFHGAVKDAKSARLLRKICQRQRRHSEEAVERAVSTRTGTDRLRAVRDRWSRAISTARRPGTDGRPRQKGSPARLRAPSTSRRSCLSTSPTTSTAIPAQTGTGLPRPMSQAQPGSPRCPPAGRAAAHRARIETTSCAGRDLVEEGGRPISLERLGPALQAAGMDGTASRDVAGTS